MIANYHMIAEIAGSFKISNGQNSCLQMIANYCMIAEIVQFLDCKGSKEICFHIQLSQRIKNIESNLSIPYTHFLDI